MILVWLGLYKKYYCVCEIALYFEYLELSGAPQPCPLSLRLQSEESDSLPVSTGKTKGKAHPCKTGAFWLAVPCASVSLARLSLVQRNEKLQGTSACVVGSGDLEGPQEELCACVNETRETAA